MVCLNMFFFWDRTWKHLNNIYTDKPKPYFLFKVMMVLVCLLCGNVCLGHLHLNTKHVLHNPGISCYCSRDVLKIAQFYNAQC